MRIICKKKVPSKGIENSLSLSLSAQRWMFFNCCWKVDCTTIGADTAAVSCVWLSSQVDSAGERQSWVFPFFPVKVVLDYLEFKIIKWAGHVGWFCLLVVQQRGRRHLLARIIFRSIQWINIYKSLERKKEEKLWLLVAGGQVWAQGVQLAFGGAVLPGTGLLSFFISFRTIRYRNSGRAMLPGISTWL